MVKISIGDVAGEYQSLSVSQQLFFFLVVQLGLKQDQRGLLFLFQFCFKKSQPWRELSFWDADYLCELSGSKAALSVVIPSPFA